MPSLATFPFVSQRSRSAVTCTLLITGPLGLVFSGAGGVIQTFPNIVALSSHVRLLLSLVSMGLVLAGLCVLVFFDPARMIRR